MRIVLPIHSFEPGGVERVALRLAARWQEGGEDVTVVLGRDQGPARIPEASALHYRSYREPLPTARWETIWMMISLYRTLRHERFDVLFCPGNTYTVVCAVMRLLLGRKCPPAVAKVSNDLLRADLPAPVRPFYRLWVRAHAAFIDRFVALAEPMAPEIIAQVGVAPERVAVIPDPALTAAELARLGAVARAPCPDEGATIVTVGRLVPQKNYPLLLTAFAAHAEAHDRLVIAGEGPERQRLERLAARLGIRDRVAFTGHCADVPALLEQADVFALSSDYEGVPAVLIEALAAGLPIVTTDCSGSISWLVGDGRDGIVVPPGDAERLGRALREVRRFGLPSAAGKARAAAFTVEQAAKTYLDLFKSVLASPHSATTDDRQSTID